MKETLEISPFGSLLVYKKGYTTELVQALIEKNQLKGLRIFAQLKNDRLADLNFLQEYSFLEALDVTTLEDYDFSFLYSLKNLRTLSITTTGINTIDLSCQHDLEALTINWGKRLIRGLEECQKISELCLIEYFDDNFRPISVLRNLNILQVKTASIDTVEGIDNFDKLEVLNLGYCKRLKSISHLSRLTQLKSLSFENCPKIHDFNSIEKLHSLENLEIIDCKKVNTIGFLKNLTSIKKLSLLGNTDVLDGDMTPAKNINEIFYAHRAHYNLKIKNEKNDKLIKENLAKIKKLFE